MKKIQTFIYVLLMGVCFAACQEDDFGGSTQGGIRIALADGTTDVDVTTRSTPSELFDGFKEKFKFQIKGDNYDQTHNWTDDVIPLAAGVYDITATCGTEQADGVVEFDKPCYTGTKEGQKVNAGETATTVEIPCEVTNALVSIKFAEGYESYAEEAYAMIAVGSGTATNWAELSESAYFKAGSSLTKLVLYRDGSESLNADILAEAKKSSDFPATFKAGDHLIITLSVAKKDGNVAIKVSKVELKKVTIEETIPMEWLPKPKVTAEGFDGNALTFVETEAKAAKLNLTLASAMQDMRLKFNFSDAQFTSLNRDTGYLWSNTQDKEIIANTLGINVSDNSVDLNGLLAKLQTNAGESTTNTIEVDVKANDRWSSEDKEANHTYTITCNKPVFRVDAYPGNIWTKEFTMNALREEQVESGDFAKISGNIKYQYSTNQEQWSDLGSDLRQANLTAGTTYYIRGLYRGEVPGEVAEVKTYPETPLTNGGLEDYTEKDNGISYGVQYEWSNWATLNELTACYCAAAAYSGNSRSSTIPKNHVRPGTAGNTAAWIVTMAYRPGTGLSSAKYTPGELFLGVYNTKGIEFGSRPTGIHFWYQYTPYDNDKSDIYVKVYSEDVEIGNGSLQETRSMQGYEECTMNIENNDNALNMEPTKLVLVFKSGFNTSTHDVTGSNSSDDPRFRGSELYIDDVSLVYDK